MAEWLRRLARVINPPPPPPPTHRLGRTYVEGIGWFTVRQQLFIGPPAPTPWPWVREGVTPDATVKPAIERHDAQGRVTRLLLRKWR